MSHSEQRGAISLFPTRTQTLLCLKPVCCSVLAPESRCSHLCYYKAPRAGDEVISFYTVMTLKLRSLPAGHEGTQHTAQLIATALRDNGESVVYLGIGTIWAVRHSLQILGYIFCDKGGTAVILLTSVFQTWGCTMFSLFSWC